LKNHPHLEGLHRRWEKTQRNGMLSADNHKRSVAARQPCALVRHQYSLEPVTFDEMKIAASATACLTQPGAGALTQRHGVF
jgi:hypothetical protein